MRHLLGFLFLFLVTFSSAFAVAVEHNAPEAAEITTAPAPQSPEVSAKALGEKIRAMKGGKKLNLVERVVLKAAAKKIEKAQKKGKSVQQTQGDLQGLLKTLGLIFIIVGAVLILLSILSFLGTGAGYGSGGGLLVLGLVLYLVAVYAL